MLQLADTSLHDRNTPTTYPETLAQSLGTLRNSETSFKRDYYYYYHPRSGSTTVELGNFHFSSTRTATHDFRAAIELFRSFDRARSRESADLFRDVLLTVHDMPALTTNAVSEASVGDWLSLYAKFDFFDIATLLDYATEYNWDGEGADPIQKETIIVARDFADRFLRGFQGPDVSASPHGAVEFDWTVESDRMFTISVGPPPDHEIVFAGLFGGEQLSGKCHCDTWPLPDELVRCFSRLKDA